MREMAIWWCCIFCWMVAPVFGQQDDYAWQQYTSRQGLPQNSIRSMAFDQHGFLWLATHAGIARFDGQNFQYFRREDYPVVSNGRYVELLRFDDSTLYFKSERDPPFYRRHATFVSLSIPEERLYHYQDALIGQMPSMDYRMLSKVYRRAVAHGGYSWLNKTALLPLDEHRVWIFSKNIWLHDYQADTLIARFDPHPIQPQRYLPVARQLLILDKNGSFFKWDIRREGFSKVHLESPDGSRLDQPFTGARIFCPYPYDCAFIQHANRLYQLTPSGTPHTYIASVILENLPENCKVLSLAYWNENNTIALGTDSRGLFVYRPKPMQTLILESEDNNAFNSFYSLSLIDSNNLLSSYGHQIQIDSFAATGRLGFPIHPLNFCIDEEQWLWTFDKNRVLYARDVPQYDQQEVALPGVVGISLLVHRNGRVWLGYRAELGYFTKRSKGVYFRCVEEHYPRVQCMAIGPWGNLWLGARNGLYRVDTLSGIKDTITIFEEAEVRTIERFGDLMFIGTYGQGYYVHDGRQLYNMPKGEDGALSHVHAFFKDCQGYIWITTNRGLFKTRLDALSNYLKDPGQGLFYYKYLEEYGIRNAEFNGGAFPNNQPLPDGKVVFPSMQGLVFVDPSRLPHTFAPDSILVERVYAWPDKQPLPAPYRIPADHNAVEVHFATAWWDQPYNLDLQYRLEGLHDAFQSCPSNQRQLSFGRLRPGKYRLFLRRRTGYQSTDFLYASINFEVLQPWYWSTWAYVGYAIALLIIVGLSNRLYSYTVRSHNRTLQRLVSDRTAELQSANQQLAENLNQLQRSENQLRQNVAIKNQLISIFTHDILPPLKFITMVSQAVTRQTERNPKNDLEAMTNVRNASARLYQNTQHILHWIQYQQEQFAVQKVTCSPYALVEELIENIRELGQARDNQLINQVPEDDIIFCDPRILSIILYNLLSNAVKFTTGGVVQVYGKRRGQNYLLGIADNGCGMSPEQLKQVRQRQSDPASLYSDAPTAGNSVGLLLVDELVTLIDGTWTIQSPGWNQGVTVEILLPH